MIKKSTFYYSLIFERKVIKRALNISLVVGIILNIVSNPDILFLNFSNLSLIKILLPFIVPFLVTVYSSVIAKSKLQIGSASHIDAAIQCVNCYETEMHIHIGDQVESCPTCNKMTKWNIKNLMSFDSNEDEIIKSLALFAKYNPQPLFRIDSKGSIVTSNLASENLFKSHDLSIQNINEVLPELQSLDFEQIIKNEAKESLVAHTNSEYLNLMVKGVSSINTAHIYGNNITDVITAQQKIKEQSIQLNKSIDYAWLIQKAMLPNQELFDEIFPENSIFYRPRDVVSGDFYWINQIEHLKILVVADSTGHGVPGAFMSMVGISLLNEIILREQIYEPDKILNQLRKRVISSLSTKEKEYKMSAGMDIALIVIDTRENILSYSGAYNPLYIVRNNELLITKADKMPIGKYLNDDIPFKINKVELETDDKIYLFTDGYKDQFGGEKDKKYSPKAFRELILELSKHPFNKQDTIISQEFDNWKMDYSQLDDVLVIGIKA